MQKKSSRRNSPNDITIAGLPIGGLDRTTPETIRALKSARVILDLTSNGRLLKRFCKNVIDLDKVYWTGELDEDVYTRIANLVLEQAADGPRVVLVVDGHPGIYQDLTWDIYDRGRRRGLKVVILPAVSFLDLMIAFCNLRIDASGLQILESTSIVAFNIPSNKLRFIKNADLWHFGILTSRIHMAWVRHVGGRLESRYQYSIGIDYNAFLGPMLPTNNAQRFVC